MRIFLSTLLILIGTLVSGCMNIAGEMSQNEVARVASPSGLVEAVLVETNGGATTSFGYDVYVIESQKKYAVDARVARLYGAVRSKSAYGVNLVWTSDQKLVIQYLNAKSAGLVISSTVVGDNTVEIVLQSGVEDNAAPPGGMLYNLQGRPQR